MIVTQRNDPKLYEYLVNKYNKKPPYGFKIEPLEQPQELPTKDANKTS